MFKLVIQIFVISIGDILSPASVHLSPSAPAPHYQQSLQYIEVRSPGDERNLRSLQYKASLENISHLQIRVEIDKVRRLNLQQLTKTGEVVEDLTEVFTLMELIKMFSHGSQHLGVRHLLGHDITVDSINSVL